MRKIKFLMGMPVRIEIANSKSTALGKDIETVFEYFRYVDSKFSTYKNNSEITKFNDGIITKKDFSNDMRKIFKLAEKTRIETQGYFNIYNGKIYDPSGIVKGWAIKNAAKLLKCLQPN